MSELTEEPPLTALEKEKLKGQQLANEISQTRLRKLCQDLLEKREVRFVIAPKLLVTVRS